jgi:hypothetical protein
MVNQCRFLELQLIPYQPLTGLIAAVGVATPRHRLQTLPDCVIQAGLTAVNCESPSTHYLKAMVCVLPAA